MRDCPGDAQQRTYPNGRAATPRAQGRLRTEEQANAQNGAKLVTALVTAAPHARSPQNRAVLGSLVQCPEAAPAPLLRAARALHAPREAGGRAVASEASATAIARAKRAPLGNNASSDSAREAAAACRSVRFRLREVARPFQRNKNGGKCGRVPHAGSVEIRRRVEDGSAHYHGLIRCGSWSACPVCSVVIAMHRAAEVRRIADAHRAAGGAFYLVTLTLPHDQGDRLEPMYHAVADSYRYVRSGAMWYQAKARIAYVGEIRALEATVGANGWHPHLHVLLFTSRALSAAERDELRAYYLRRWCASVVRFGYRAPTAEHGVTIVESHRDEYVAKMGLADELAKGGSKDAHRASRTPLQVLADLAESGDSADLDLWREWVLSMHGARQLTWSRGLRERYAVDAEKSDAEVVAGESQGADEQIAVIAPDMWRTVVRVDAGLMWQLLDAAERGGADEVDALMRRRLGALLALPT